jgi:uncharacterized protein (DUF885 family)
MKTLLFVLCAASLVAGFTVELRPQSDDLHKLFADYYEFKLREDPRQATSVGRNDYNDRWDNPSPEHERQRRAGLQKMLDRLHAFPEAQTAGQDRLSYRLMDWIVKSEISDIDVVSTYTTIDHFHGGHLNIFSTMAKAPAHTMKEYEDQVARVRALPEWVDQTIAAANLSIEQKRTQPRRVAELVVKELDGQMAPDALQAFLNRFRLSSKSIFEKPRSMPTTLHFGRRGRSSATTLQIPTSRPRANRSGFHKCRTAPTSTPIW